MIFDQKDYDKQRAAQQAETERLKALWAKESKVDTSARRSAAEKAEAEKKARETPSPEDIAQGQEILKRVNHRWLDQRKDGPKHRLHFEDNNAVRASAHVSSFKAAHPFKMSAWVLSVTLPADKFADTEWCSLTIQLFLEQNWLEVIEQCAQETRAYAHRLMNRLSEHEARQRPQPRPQPFNFTEFEGLAKLTEGQEITSIISAKVVAIDRATGTLRCLVTDHGADSHHVLAGKEYEFTLNKSWAGDYNMWSLRPEEHECWDGRGHHGADLLLVYDEGDWNFDLDD